MTAKPPETSERRQCPLCCAVDRTHGSPCIDVAPQMAHDLAALRAENAELRAERDTQWHLTQEAVRDVVALRAERDRLMKALGEAVAWLGAAKRSGAFAPDVRRDIDKAFWDAQHALKIARTAASGEKAP